MRTAQWRDVTHATPPWPHYSYWDQGKTAPHAPTKSQYHFALNSSQGSGLSHGTHRNISPILAKTHARKCATAFKFDYTFRKADFCFSGAHEHCTAYTVRKGREEISDNEPDLQYQLQTTEPYPLASLCLPYLDFCFFWGGKTTPFPPPCTFHHGISSGLDLIDWFWSSADTILCRETYILYQCHPYS